MIEDHLSRTTEWITKASPKMIEGVDAVEDIKRTEPLALYWLFLKSGIGGLFSGIAARRGPISS